MNPIVVAIACLVLAIGAYVLSVRASRRVRFTVWGVSHMRVGDRVRVSGDALPDGLSPNVDYRVVNVENGYLTLEGRRA